MLTQTRSADKTPQIPGFLLAVFPVCDIQTGIEGTCLCAVHRLCPTLPPASCLWMPRCLGAFAGTPLIHMFPILPLCPFITTEERFGKGSFSLPFSLFPSLTPPGGDHRMPMWQEHNSGLFPSVDYRMLPTCCDLWLSPGVIRQGQQVRVSICSVRGLGCYGGMWQRKKG